MYVAAVGLLWTSTRILAPTAEKSSVLRCLGAAVLMTFFGNASRHFLAPLIGDWHALVGLLAYVVVAKVVFKLAFWRSVLVARDISDLRLRTGRCPNAYDDRGDRPP